MVEYRFNPEAREWGYGDFQVLLEFDGGLSEGLRSDISELVTHWYRLGRVGAFGDQSWKSLDLWRVTAGDDSRYVGFRVIARNESAESQMRPLLEPLVRACQTTVGKRGVALLEVRVATYEDETFMLGGTGMRGDWEPGDVFAGDEPHHDTPTEFLVPRTKGRADQWFRAAMTGRDDVHGAEKELTAVLAAARVSQKKIESLLSTREPISRKMVSRLLQVFSDTDSRRLKVLVLVLLGRAGSEAVPGLVEIFKTSEGGERAIVGNALARLATKESLDAILGLALEPVFGVDRQSLLLSLGRFGDASVAAQITPLVDDPEVGGYALAALCEMALPETKPVFERHVDDPEAWIAKVARHGLNRIRYRT